MILADALSRMPNRNHNKDVELDVRVDGIAIHDDNPEHQSITMINFSTEQQRELQEETCRDAAMNALKDTIYTGWPETIQELPTDLRVFWPYRDELSVETGVIVKGRQVMIPPKLRKEIMRLLHIGHQGIEKTRSYARETVYWSNMNKDIERVCKECITCQEYMERSANKREPIIPHKQPSKPW